MEVFGLILLFGVFVFVIHFCVAFVLFCVNEDWPIYYTPATFYELTSMNWIGCVLVWILLFPFAFVFELGGLFKWLFTVGRKD